MGKSKNDFLLRFTIYDSQLQSIAEWRKRQRLRSNEVDQQEVHCFKVLCWLKVLITFEVTTNLRRKRSAVPKMIILLSIAGLMKTTHCRVRKNLFSSAEQFYTQSRPAITMRSSSNERRTY